MNKIRALGGGNIHDHNDLKRSETRGLDAESSSRSEPPAQGRPARGGQPRASSCKKGLGADELNFAEFPLAVFSRRLGASQKTVEFEDDVYDEGAKQSVRRRLVISGSDRYGLPTPADTDVLLVLIQLTKHRSNFEA